MCKNWMVIICQIFGWSSLSPNFCGSKVSLHIIIVIIIVITSSGDLQPSTAIANQLPGQLVYTQITTRGPNCFKFIIALIMPSRNIV